VHRTTLYPVDHGLSGQSPTRVIRRTQISHLPIHMNWPRSRRGPFFPPNLRLSPARVCTRLQPIQPTTDPLRSAIRSTNTCRHTLSVCPGRTRRTRCGLSPRRSRLPLAWILERTHSRFVGGHVDVRPVDGQGVEPGRMGRLPSISRLGNAESPTLVLHHDSCLEIQRSVGIIQLQQRSVIPDILIRLRAQF